MNPENSRFKPSCVVGSYRIVRTTFDNYQIFNEEGSQRIPKSPNCGSCKTALTWVANHLSK